MAIAFAGHQQTAAAACQQVQQDRPAQAISRRQPRRLALTVAAAAAASDGDGCSPLVQVSRSSVFRSMAAGALVMVSGLAGAGPAAAVSSADGAEQVAAGCRGFVAAVSAIAGGQTAAPVEQQLGSGIVWDSQGHIVTPYAPLTRLQRGSRTGDAQILVSLTAADGSTHQLTAAVVGKDPSHELIVLKVDPPAAGLQPIVAGSSADLRVGQDAYLLGGLPGGGNVTVTTGVISAVGRVIPASNNQAIPGVLQTDAEVDSQSLGGPLCDSSGRLVGMPVVSYVKPGTGRSSGVNFALSVDELRTVVPRLIVYGSAAIRR